MRLASDENDTVKTMSTILRLSKWLIPLLLTAVLSIGSIVGSKVDSRFNSLESDVARNSLDIGEQKVEIKNNSIQFEEMQQDIKQIRDREDQIFMILSKKK